MFSGMSVESFLSSLVSGGPKMPLAKSGLVKTDEHIAEFLLFSTSSNCENWMQIPIAAIDKIDYISTMRCGDHTHPYVKLHFKEPPAENKIAGLFAELLRSGSEKKQSCAR